MVDELVFPKSDGDILYASEVNRYFRMHDLGSTALSVAGSFIEIIGLNTGSFSQIKFQLDAIGSFTGVGSRMMQMMLDGRSGTDFYRSRLLLIEGAVTVATNDEKINCGWFNNTKLALLGGGSDARSINIAGIINNNNISSGLKGVNSVYGNMNVLGSTAGADIVLNFYQFAGTQIQGSIAINRVSFVASGVASSSAGALLSGTRMQLWGIR